MSIYVSIYAYVYYFDGFAGNISDFSDTKHNGLKILPFIDRNSSKEKNTHCTHVSTCCAEAQNSHCGLRVNYFRQCYDSCI